MYRVLLLGAGKIGRTIARLLGKHGHYEILVGDADEAALESLEHLSHVRTTNLDCRDEPALLAAMQDCDAVISALSFEFNAAVARAALQAGISYFDLTEDIETTHQVRELSKRAGPKQIFMPQCGLAPGFICIVANHLANQFDEVDTIHMRVGALPRYASNTMSYNLTWSTDGLINEYCNMCDAIQEGELIKVLPLEGLELLYLDGIRYEAFNTSGGLGTLTETFAGRVRELNYKTMRYVGHRDLMTFLMDELRFREQEPRDRRKTLKNILERTIPITYQDVVVVFCSVSGKKDGQLVQISDVRKVYERQLPGESASWSAIQITTAAGFCAVLDLHVAGRLPASGFVRQEDVVFPDFLSNQFGQYYSDPSSSV